MMLMGMFDGGVVSETKLTQMILDYADLESWKKMSEALETLIQAPQKNIPTLASAVGSKFFQEYLLHTS